MPPPRKQIHEAPPELTETAVLELTVTTNCPVVRLIR